MVEVYLSRYNTNLKPGDGDKLHWEIGEEVKIISGQDKGRHFIITSDRRSHPDLDSGYVREGYFADDVWKVKWAKPEKTLWYI